MVFRYTLLPAQQTFIKILYFIPSLSTPQDPESQRSTREIAEQQARKSALAMAGSIVRVATELMIMGLGVGDESAVEVLGSAPLITMLLPLVLSHIGPVATSDPRVRREIVHNIFFLQTQ